MVVDEKDDDVQNENDLEILEGNDINDELPTHMMIIFNRCNAIFFISHLFLNTYFLYMLICLFLIEGCWTKMVGGGMRMRRGRRSTRRTAEEAQQDDDVQQQVEQQATVDVAQQDDDDAQQDASGSGASGSSASV
jgi:hypothetical protein